MDEDTFGDQVRYRDAPGPILVDLEAAGSAAGHGDDVIAGTYYRLQGSPYADAIRGSARGELIDAGGGSDRIGGGPGRDELVDLIGLSSVQTVDGGTGDDRLVLGDLYVADGQRVYPLTAIDLIGGFAAVPRYGVRIPFAGVEDLETDLPVESYTCTSVERPSGCEVSDGRDTTLPGPDVDVCRAAQEPMECERTP